MALKLLYRLTFFRVSNYCSRDFREEILVQQYVSADDGFGGSTRSYSDLGNIWGKVTDKAANEGEISGRVKATKSIEVITHYRTDIKETDRLVLDGVTYNIRGVINIDRDSLFLQITADNRDE